MSVTFLPVSCAPAKLRKETENLFNFDLEPRSPTAKERGVSDRERSAFEVNDNSDKLYFKTVLEESKSFYRNLLLKAGVYPNRSEI